MAAVFTAAARAAATAPWHAVVRDASLHVSRPTHWLESRFHFNFANFHEGAENFGVLRVVNDDIVKGRSGFGTHPHRAMEIFSYVLTGRLAHKDSMGSAESLGRGAVQYMSAGTGLTHSELNDEADPVHFLQIWILPTAEGRRVPPRYGSREYSHADRRNTLLPIVQNILDPSADDRSCKIHQDVNVYASELEGAAGPLRYTLQPGRQLYLVNAEGETDVVLGGVPAAVHLGTRDGFKVKAAREPVELELGAVGRADSHFVLIEMPLSADL